MRTIKPVQLANAAKRNSEFAAMPSGAMPESLTEARAQSGFHSPPGSARMSETMRTVLWVTGVAFGVTAPCALAQTTADVGVKPAKTARLDARAPSAARPGAAGAALLTNPDPAPVRP